MRGPSAALQTALDELNRQGKGNNETFTAATFTFSQNFVLDAFASLKKGHACDLDPLQAAFDAMFFSLEPKRDGEDAHNNLANDSMSCRPLAAQPATDKHPARSLVSTTLKGFRAGSAYAALVDPNNEPKISSDDLTKLVSASSTAGQSFLKDNAGAAIYACDWSNTDDESATALIAVNAGTKQLRVLFGYVGP